MTAEQHDPVVAGHAFLSYVREDSAQVERLQRALQPIAAAQSSRLADPGGAQAQCPDHPTTPATSAQRAGGPARISTARSPQLS